MNYVIVDTASPSPSLQLHVDGKAELTVAACHRDPSFSNEIMAEIKGFLASKNMLPSDLDFIALTTGPGSYTGIRVGAALVRGFVYATGIPVITLSTLKGLPEPKGYVGRYFALIDARIGGFYLQEFETFESGIADNIGDPELCPLDQVSTRIPDGSLIVTCDSHTIRKRCTELYDLERWTWHESYMCGAELACWARNDFANGRVYQGTDFPLLYLRKTQAELALES